MTRLPDRGRELLLEFTGKLLVVPQGPCGKGSHDYLRPSFPLLRRLPGTMLALTTDSPPASASPFCVCLGSPPSPSHSSPSRNNSQHGAHDALKVEHH